MAVLATEAQLRIDLAALFRIAAKLGWPEAVANHASVALDADGRRFLMVKEGPAPPRQPGEMRVVLNWFEELRRRAPLPK